MANLNKVMLIGNLTRDPELRYTPKGTAVADITLAINRIWNNDQNVRQEETVFVEITLWGRQAELAQQYLAKGRLAYVEGRLHMDTWDDKETGKKRSKLKVVGEVLQFMPDGKGGNTQTAPAGQAPLRPAGPPRNQGPPQGASPATGDLPDDDEIPF